MKIKERKNERTKKRQGKNVIFIATEIFTGKQMPFTLCSIVYSTLNASYIHNSGVEMCKQNRMSTEREKERNEGDTKIQAVSLFFCNLI